MKVTYRLLMFIFLLITVAGCNKEEDEDLMGNWSELSDFDGVPRSDAVGFALNGKGYIGTGYDGDERLKDFWEYNPDMNYWIQKADFPGVARTGAIGIGINGKGYIGTGYDGEEKLNDFWGYDPETNTWEQKADYTGSGRYGAVAFSIEDIGYVGAGYDGNVLKDFYAYSPSSDTWTQIISIGGSKRMDATAFVIDGKAYVVSGLDNGSYLGDMWQFDPGTGFWTEMRSIFDDTDEKFDDEYTSVSRISAIGMAFNGKGYLATGSSGSLLSTVWEYDPSTDLWEERTAFEGTTRTEAVGFSIGSRGYITTGRSSSYYLDDIWSFDPTAEYDEDN